LNHAACRPRSITSVVRSQIHGHMRLAAIAFAVAMPLMYAILIWQELADGLPNANWFVVGDPAPRHRRRDARLDVAGSSRGSGEGKRSARSRVNRMLIQQMRDLPFRTNTTWLSDDDLILLDVPFPMGCTFFGTCGARTFTCSGTSPIRTISMITTCAAICAGCAKHGVLKAQPCGDALPTR